jgi:L-asparaginase/Glu-tRNA(Gln) amidotransferase subunit D
MNTRSPANNAAENQDDESRATAERELAESKQYDPDARKSVAVPGTGGTISGTAFADHVADMSEETVERLEKSYTKFEAEQAKLAAQ